MKSVLLALVVLGSALSLHAQQGLPSLPTASQIFSVEDIKQYWLHKLSQKPLPPRPNSENSVILRSWQESIQAHNSMLDSIRQGELDDYARLVQLTHNEKAYRNLGMNEKAQATAEKLGRLQQQKLAHKQTQELHQAQLETFKLQQRAAQAQVTTSQEIRRLREDFATLQAERDRLITELSTANSALSQANSKISNLENEVYNLRNRIVIPVRTQGRRNTRSPFDSRRSPFDTRRNEPDNPPESSNQNRRQEK